MGQHETAAQSNCGGYNQCIDRKFAASPRSSKKVTSDSGDASAGRDYLREPLCKHAIDWFVWFVVAGSAIELDEYRGGNPNRRVSKMSTAHCGTHVVVAIRASCRPRQR